MVMHLLVNKIAQNSSTKRVLEVELFVPLKNTTKTWIYGALKFAQKCEKSNIHFMWKKQYAFYVAVDDPFETLECTSECT